MKKKKTTFLDVLFNLLEFICKRLFPVQIAFEQLLDAFAEFIACSL